MMRYVVLARNYTQVREWCRTQGVCPTAALFVREGWTLRGLELAPDAFVILPGWAHAVPSDVAEEFFLQRARASAERERVRLSGKVDS